MFDANPPPPPPGGFFFAKPMRENKYVTMMDPFQQKYGNVVSSALIFPALVADVLWVARTLVSLGKLFFSLCKTVINIICAHTYLHMYSIMQQITDQSPEQHGDGCTRVQRLFVCSLGLTAGKRVKRRKT